MGEKEVVAIARCKSYKQEEVDRAVTKLLKLLDFPVNEYENKKVLIKPNVLGVYKKNMEATITNINIVKSLLKQFKNAKVGESSITDTEINLRKTGYWKLNPIVFEEKKLIKINDKKARVLKHFLLPKPVVEADLVINVPKMKTHTLTKMTGAIKNLYGCIPGGVKQMLHKKAIGEKKFSSLLVDIYQNIKPGLNIMDAVVAMEGNGPSAGKRKKVRLILASRNAVALDIAASKLMGFKNGEILAVDDAVERGLASYKIQIIGDLKKIPNLKFEKPSRFNNETVKAIFSGMTKDKIVCNKEKCVKCGICMKHCPAKAITLNPFPEINPEKCIRCFCCIEVCPNHALHLKDNMLVKVAKIMKKREKSRKSQDFLAH